MNLKSRIECLDEMYMEPTEGDSPQTYAHVRELIGIAIALQSSVELAMSRPLISSKPLTAAAPGMPYSHGGAVTNGATD